MNIETAINYKTGEKYYIVGNQEFHKQDNETKKQLLDRVHRYLDNVLVEY